MEVKNFKITLCQRPLPPIIKNDVKVFPISPEDSIRNYIVSYLEKSGHPVTLTGNNQSIKNDPQSIVLMIGSVNWYPKIFRQLKSMSEKKRPSVVIWHTEPLLPPKKAKLPWPRLHLREIAKILLRDKRTTDPYSNYFKLRHLNKNKLINLTVVPTLCRQEFLEEKGIPSIWNPLGYEPSYGNDLRFVRDIDVLFLGISDIPCRKNTLNYLRQSGINMIESGSWFDRDCWGENRTELLNRTKILLNLQRFPGELSEFRLILGMANKALVISEPIYKPDTFIPGKHFVSARKEEIPDLINYYLVHDKERQQIADEGHKHVTQELTMEKSMANLMKIFRQQMN